MTLWRLQELADICGVTYAGQDASVRAFSIDSRSLQPGDVFVALAGNNGDGHGFIDKAFAAGAVAVIASRPVDHDNVLIVPDTLAALQTIATAARARSRAQFFAITGSVGKTGTRAMLELAMSGCGQTHASIKSYNNHWGVPLTLANMPCSAEYGVFEVGMSHAGEITPLAQMVRPDIGIITEIQAQHIENFDGIEGIADAKSELFKGMSGQGIAVLPADSDYLPRLIDNARAEGVSDIRCFGEAETADAVLSDIRIQGQESRGIVTIEGQSVEVTLPILGAHHLRNASAVLLAVHAAGHDVKKAAESLQELESQQGRGRIIWLNGGAGDPDSVALIDESYNAAPVAVQAAIGILASLNHHEKRRRIAVLGDIYELGDRQDDVIEELVVCLKQNHIDLVHVCGPMMDQLLARLPEAMRGVADHDPERLAQAIEPDIAPGDTVMIKGSRGPGQKPRMQILLETLDDALRRRFNSAH